MRDVDLSRKLHFAESNFLTALESGTDMLSSYHQSWSGLRDILHTASRNGTVSQDTLSLAHSVASRILNLTSYVVDTKCREESYSASFQSDCDAMIHQMARMDLNALPKSLHSDNENSPRHFHSYSSTFSSNAESSSPPFLTSVHQWLLDNLHNPYPTVEVKTRIAAASSCQVTSVSSWFVNARRRIGWTSLCREHFSNCRADMIDAAYRALVKEDPHRMLSPEVRHAFVAMKVAAEGLYSSTFTRSAFTGDPDAIAKDMMKKDRKSAEAGKYPQEEQANLTKAVRDSYTSPYRSITASPVPALDESLTDESDEEEDVAPPIIAGSKRPRSSAEPVDQSTTTLGRPIKRLRASITSQTYLPSPPSSTDGIEVPSDCSSPKFSPVHFTQPETNEVLPSRKRGLPDANATGTPKRSRSPVAPPRRHIVSDSLPRFNMENECSIDGWFDTNFDALFAIPSPVDATEPDFSASLEVELFKDYRIPGNPKCAPKYPPALMADPRISVPADLSDLDSLLQSIGDDAFVIPSECVPLSDIPGPLYAPSLDPSIPDILPTNIDWTSLFNSPDSYQPAIHSTFLRHPTDTQPLPEIDLSVSQLPHVMPTVNSDGDFALKHAKLDQLHALQEAVRRMEQELQSEGVII